jgi:hypothetical protein
LIEAGKYLKKGDMENAKKKIKEGMWFDNSMKDILVKIFNQEERAGIR